MKHQSISSPHTSSHVSSTNNMNPPDEGFIMFFQVLVEYVMLIFGKSYTHDMQ